MFDVVEETLKPFGWRVKWEKAEILSTYECEHVFQLRGVQVATANSFQWLGCTITHDASAHKHLESRGALAMAAWNILKSLLT